MLLHNAKRLDGYALGIDFSLTGTGVYWAAMQEGLPEYAYELVSDKDQNDLDRVIEIRDVIVNDILVMQEAGFLLPVVTIEDYGPINRMSGKIAQRAECVGMIKHFILTETDADIVTVEPKSLKKWATGNGNSGKEPMKTSAARQYAFFTTSDNMADAAHCAHFGIHYYSGIRLNSSFHVYKH